MTKVTLADVVNLQNENTAVGVINANSALIETGFDNTISRDGTTPNHMNADLDMNSNQIINLGTPLNDNDAVRLTDLENLTDIDGLSPSTAFGRVFVNLEDEEEARDYIDAQEQDSTLDALSSYDTNGLVTQTATDTFTGRTIIAPAAGITVTNGNGVSGNPTLALSDDLEALEGLSGTDTIYYRSAANTWSPVTVGTNLGFTGGTLSSTFMSPRVLLDSKLAADSASLDFPTLFSTYGSTYPHFEIVIVNLSSMSSSAGTFRIQVYVSGVLQTSSYLGGMWGATAGGSGGASALTTGVPTSYVGISGMQGITGHSSFMRVSDVRNTNTGKLFYGHASAVNNSGTFWTSVVGGSYSSTSPLDGFQVNHTGGNLAHGYVYVYGVI